jgi:hypothetical protein
MRMSPMHFIEVDLEEDWLASIDWDAIVDSILVRGGWSRPGGSPSPCRAVASRRSPRRRRRTHGPRAHAAGELAPKQFWNRAICEKHAGWRTSILLAAIVLAAVFATATVGLYRSRAPRITPSCRPGAMFRSCA